MTEKRPKLNLYQKLVEVRKSIDFFKKDTQGYGYTYVSGSQILKKIKDKLDELQIILIPVVLNQKHETFYYKQWDRKDKREKEKTDFIVTADMKYIWVNAENPDERIEVPWQTMGQHDDISKAFGSGLTYSERYFLLKFFGVPTDEEDPDARDTNEKHSTATEKQLNLITNLLKRNANEKYSAEDLYKHLKKKMGTEKDMENWTVQEASKAIEILQGKR